MLAIMLLIMVTKAITLLHVDAGDGDNVSDDGKAGHCPLWIRVRWDLHEENDADDAHADHHAASAAGIAVGDGEGGNVSDDGKVHRALSALNSS